MGQLSWLGLGTVSQTNNLVRPDLVIVTDPGQYNHCKGIHTLYCNQGGFSVGAVY